MINRVKNSIFQLATIFCVASCTSEERAFITGAATGVVVDEATRYIQEDPKPNSPTVYRLPMRRVKILRMEERVYCYRLSSKIPSYQAYLRDDQVFAAGGNAYYKEIIYDPYRGAINYFTIYRCPQGF